MSRSPLLTRRSLLVYGSATGLSLLGLTAQARATADELFKAAKFNDAESILSLLNEGVDPNSQDINGNTALLMALREKALKAADVLMRHPKTNLTLANHAGEAPVMMASLHGQLIQLIYMVEMRGIEINQPGWTALHYAASMGQDEIVKYLLDRAAYIDAESPNGTTPLMMAVRGGYIKTVKLLLDEGADMALKNQQGMNAIDFAKRYQQEEIYNGLIARWRKLNQPKSW